MQPMGERIAVLVSGNGTNLQALLDDSFCGPRISLVLADRPAIRALERAERRGVQTLVIEPSSFADRSAFDEAVAAALQRHGADVVVSAGYMRVLGPEVVGSYGGRWLNVHPALLPSFPGMHGVRDALEHGVKVTGVTVYLVDEGVDTGPIVLQEAIVPSATTTTGTRSRRGSSRSSTGCCRARCARCWTVGSSSTAGAA